jgi:hypothetical protein
LGKSGNPDPVDQRRPEKIDGIDAENQSGPTNRLTGLGHLH